MHWAAEKSLHHFCASNPRLLTQLVEMDCGSSLPKFGCPHAWPTSSISFMKAWKATSTYVAELSDQFPITNSIKQGCVLVHTLFGLFFPAVLQDATLGLNSGIFLQMRKDDVLLNLAILRTKRKVRDIVVHELQFADDCALVANSLEDILETTSHFASAAKDLGLTISLKKQKFCTSQLIAHAMKNQLSLLMTLMPIPSLTSVTWAA